MITIMGVDRTAQDGTASYDDFFRENYTILLKWANQITRQDHDLSHDLVHDLYVRFNLSKRRPEDVGSPHGYLYTAIRNSYISYVRNKTRTRQVSLPEDELVNEAGLVIDPQTEFSAHDELRTVCEHVCIRKDSSISASVLILRFFHGYYPAEVSKIIKRSRNAVEARLVKARREAYDHLTQRALDTRPLGFRGAQEPVRKEFNYSRGDLLRELREHVFQSRNGPCLSHDWLEYVYKKDVGIVGREELSHLVSCSFCLDDVNKTLDLPLLHDRHPLDTLGNQTAAEVIQLVKYKTAGASG